MRMHRQTGILCDVCTLPVAILLVKGNTAMIAKTMVMSPAIVPYSTAGLLDCGDGLDESPCREGASVVATPEEN